MTTGSQAFFEECNARFPRSRQLAERAARVIPRLVTHDGRHMLPFPIYVERAKGSRKWDVDGHEYVDYAGGHGALLLGHSHPDILAAIQQALPLGTHLGSSHEREIRWAELITQLVPSGERVEFTMSGTEAVMMAVRIARAFTGRDRLVKFQGHFHGWYDNVYVGLADVIDAPASAGISPAILGTATVVPCNDIEAIRRTLAQRDVAAVILEPGGASASTLPVGARILEQLREETRRTGTLLIFDEVITGFRYSPGGAQQYYGVIPDLTTLGKIVGGGMPAAAVTGRAEIMATLEYGHKNAAGQPSRVTHTGTYNANPVTAAAAIAMLERVATGLPTERATAASQSLRLALSEVLARSEAAGCIYGERSICHIHLAPQERCPKVGEDGAIPPEFPLVTLLRDKAAVSADLKRAMLLEGVDLLSDHAWVSAAHTSDDVEWTAQAFARALKRLLAAGLIPRR